MKRFFSLFILLFQVLFAGHAQTKPALKNHSLLWKISGNGSPKPSYLFGTIHLICPDDYIWTEAMQRSLRSCRKLCLEMDMDDTGVISSATAGLMNEGSKKLKDYFTPEQYMRLRAFTEQEMRLSIDQFQAYKPVALESLFLMKVAGCTMPVSYEQRLMDKAHTAKQEVIGLEQPSEQIAALASVPDDSMVQSMMQMVDSITATQKEWGKMVAAYKEQNLPELSRQINESKDLGEDLGELLDKRNARWISRIEQLIKVQPVFFAVGAGHLWGDAGVIALLRKAGYKVEPVQ